MLLWSECQLDVPLGRRTLLVFGLGEKNKPLWQRYWQRAGRQQGVKLRISSCSAPLPKDLVLASCPVTFPCFERIKRCENSCVSVQPMTAGDRSYGQSRGQVSCAANDRVDARVSIRSVCISACQEQDGPSPSGVLVGTSYCEPAVANRGIMIGST